MLTQDLTKLSNQLDDERKKAMAALEQKMKQRRMQREKIVAQLVSSGPGARARVGVFSLGLGLGLILTLPCFISRLSQTGRNSRGQSSRNWSRSRFCPDEWRKSVSKMQRT